MISSKTRVHVAGLIGLFMSGFIALCALLLVSLATSYSGAAPEPGAQHTLRVGIAIIGLLFALFPLATAVSAEKLGARPHVWVGVTLLVIAMTASLALTATPTPMHWSAY